MPYSRYTLCITHYVEGRHTKTTLSTYAHSVRDAEQNARQAMDENGGIVVWVRRL